MTRVVLLAATLAALTGCSGTSTTVQPASGPAPGMSDQELLQTEKDWSTALARHDTMFFDRTLADDFVQVGGGKVETKRDFLATLSGPADSSFQLTDVRPPIIRHYGSATVINGLIEYPTKERVAYTELWTSEQGLWQVHLGHYNSIRSGADTAR
jgi:Domain of unknown function (DUF4440)